MVALQLANGAPLLVQTALPANLEVSSGVAVVSLSADFLVDAKPLGFSADEPAYVRLCSPRWSVGSTSAASCRSESQLPSDDEGEVVFEANNDADEVVFEDVVVLSERGDDDCDAITLADSEEEEEEEEEARPTTLLLRNLPRSFNTTKLIELFHREGFQGSVNFAYVPVKFGSGECLSYAFVNAVSVGAAARLQQHFSGFAAWNCPTEGRCIVEPAAGTIGLDANVERYRNSPVMHSSVPEEYKPTLLVDGVRVAFPEPTVALRAPRLRRSA